MSTRAALPARRGRLVVLLERLPFSSAGQLEGHPFWAEPDSVTRPSGASWLEM